MSSPDAVANVIMPEDESGVVNGMCGYWILSCDVELLFLLECVSSIGPKQLVVSISECLFG